MPIVTGLVVTTNHPHTSHLGCDFVRPNRCAKEQLGTGVVGWHLLHFFVYLHDFVAALRLQMRKTKKI